LLRPRQTVHPSAREEKKVKECGIKAKRGGGGTQNGPTPSEKRACEEKKNQEVQIFFWVKVPWKNRLRVTLQKGMSGEGGLSREKLEREEACVFHYEKERRVTRRGYMRKGDASAGLGAGVQTNSKREAWPFGNTLKTPVSGWERVSGKRPQASQCARGGILTGPRETLAALEGGRGRARPIEEDLCRGLTTLDLMREMVLVNSNKGEVKGTAKKLEEGSMEGGVAACWKRDSLTAGRSWKLRGRRLQETVMVCWVRPAGSLGGGTPNRGKT